MRLPIASIISGAIALIYSLPAFSVSIDQTALEILKDSPEFQSENYALESNRNNLLTTYNLPDPEVGGEYLWMPSDVDNRWTIELTWGLEWPGVYDARKKEAKAMMTAAEKNVFYQRAARLAEIKDLLLDYIQCRQKLILLDRLSQNNDSICKLAENVARSGEMTVLDLNKVKLEHANIRVARAGILDEEAQVIADISKIYGRNCSGLLANMDCRFPDMTIPSVDEMTLVMDNAPSVQAAMAEAEAAKRGKRVALMEAYPNISLGYKHAFEDAMHFNGILFGVSIPVFSSKGKQKAKKAEILEAEFKAEAAKMEIESDAMATYRRLLLINSQIEELSPLVENADYNAALLKAYKGGELSLIDYISDRNYFTTAAVELVSLRHSAAKSFVLLQRYLTR